MLLNRAKWRAVSFVITRPLRLQISSRATRHQLGVLHNALCTKMTRGPNVLPLEYSRQDREGLKRVPYPCLAILCSLGRLSLACSLLLRPVPSKGIASTASREKATVSCSCGPGLRIESGKGIGQQGEELDTWKVLKICSIKCIEPGNTVSQHGGDESGIEGLTSCNEVLAKKREPTVNHIQWYRQQRQAGKRSQLPDR
jgi:hypothetical protein